MLCPRPSSPHMPHADDNFYSGLLQFLKACDEHGTVGAPELKDLIVADTNGGCWAQRQLLMLRGAAGLERVCDLPRHATHPRKQPLPPCPRFRTLPPSLPLPHFAAGVLDVLRAYYLHMAPLSPDKTFRASVFLEAGGSAAQANAAGL